MTGQACGTCAHADCELAGLVESCERWADTDDAGYSDSASFERCEWYPEIDELAPSGLIGCQNEATVSVGTGKQNLHLCDSCATLSRFKGRKKKPLKKEG